MKGFRNCRIAMFAILGLASATPLQAGVPVTLTPNPHDFSDILVGSASADVQFTLNNPLSEALTITSISMEGANPDQFVLSGNTCGAVVAAMTQCTFNVRFTPGSVGHKVALAEVVYTTPSTPGGAIRDAVVSGDGVVPAAVSTVPVNDPLALVLGALALVLSAAAFLRRRVSA